MVRERVRRVFLPKAVRHSVKGVEIEVLLLLPWADRPVGGLWEPLKVAAYAMGGYDVYAMHIHEA